MKELVENYGFNTKNKNLFMSYYYSGLGNSLQYSVNGSGYFLAYSANANGGGLNCRIDIDGVTYINGQAGYTQGGIQISPLMRFNTNLSVYFGNTSNNQSWLNTGYVLD